MKKCVGVNLVDGANFVNSLDSFLSQFSCQVLIFIYLIGRNLSKYFSNDPPNQYWISQSNYRTI